MNWAVYSGCYHRGESSTDSLRTQDKDEEETRYKYVNLDSTVTGQDTIRVSDRTSFTTRRFEALNGALEVTIGQLTIGDLVKPAVLRIKFKRAGDFGLYWEGKWPLNERTNVKHFPVDGPKTEIMLYSEFPPIGSLFITDYDKANGLFYYSIA
jgi:hypothetical protein